MGRGACGKKSLEEALRYRVEMAGRLNLGGEKEGRVG
jgi:hypothetical protein